jgi:hypothetical protein
MILNGIPNKGQVSRIFMKARLTLLKILKGLTLLVKIIKSECAQEIHTTF